MTREEIMIRQMAGQHLLKKTDKKTVLHDLLGVQAQITVNAYHALKIRCHDLTEENFGAGLVKNWTLRGTVHIFAKEDLPLFVRCRDGREYLCKDFCGYTFWNQRDVWSLTPERQRFLTDVILEALSDGAKTRDELKEICRAHGMTALEEGSMFDSWGGGIREMCVRGFINHVVQEKKAFCLAPPYTPMREEEAKLAIARRYFTHFGPATIHDAMYFLGAKQSEVKAWLAVLPVQSVEFAGKTYFYIENGEPPTADIPPCLFLAGFDQLMLGYQKKESLYLPPEHLRGIFNLAGIVMPAVLLRGRVVGRWKKKGARLSATLFEPLSADDRTIISDAAEVIFSDLRELFFE